MGPGYFEKLRFRYVVWTVLLALGLLAYGDTEARPFHLLVLAGTLAGLYLPDRVRLAVPVMLWNIVVVTLLALSFVWIRRDVSKVFEILLYFLEVLLIVKAFSRRSSRDYWQIYLACYFVVIAGVISLSSIWIIPVLMVFVALLSLAMVADTVAEPEIPQEGFSQPVLAERAKRFPDLAWGAVAVVALTVAVAVINFVAIPRLSRAFFDLGFMRSGGSTRTGLSGQVDLSQKGRLELDPEITGRLKIIGLDGDPAEQPTSNYLIAKRLDVFDGTRWSASEGALARLPVSQSKVHWITPDDVGKPSVKYSLLLKPAGQPFVLQLPNTAALHFTTPLPILRDEKLGNLTFEQNPVQVYRYEGWSTLRGHPDTLSSRRLAELTSVPDSVSSGIRDLSKTFGGDGLAPREITRRIDDFFSRGFGYSLERSQGGGPDVLDKFLFTDRQGHCEYFASAAVLLARLNGIPARLVTGYLVTDRTADNEWLIREQDAHAWVEYFDPAEGWLTMDPSPRNPEAERSLRSGWRDRLATWMGRMEFWWFDAVIDFSLSDQFELLQGLLQRLNSDPAETAAKKTSETSGKTQLPSFGSREFFNWAAGAVGILVLCGWALWLWLRKADDAALHPATRELHRLLHALGRKGPLESSGQTPAATVRTAARQLGLAARRERDLGLWIDLYQQSRFGPPGPAADLAKLKNLTDDLIASATEKRP